MKEENNIDKAIREKLKGFSVPPPPHIWANVQGQMAAQQRQKRMVYAGWISAAAVVVLALLAGWYFGNSPELSTPLQAEQQTVQPASKTEKITAPKEEDSVGQNVNLKTQATRLVAQNSNSEAKPKANKTQNAVNSFQESAENPVAEALKTKETVPANATRPAVNEASLQPLKSIDAQMKTREPTLALATQAAPKKEPELTDADKFLMASNAGVGNSKPRAGTSWKMGLSISPGYSSQAVSHSESYAKEMTNTGDNGTGNIGGGFSVQYKTTKKLSIESGVYYAQNGQSSANSPNLFAASNRNNDYIAAPNNSFNVIADASTSYSNTVSLSNGNVVMNANAGTIELTATAKGVEITTEAEAIGSDFENTLVTDGEFSQVFDFIEIPLFLRFSIVDSKFGIDLVGGVNAGIVVGNNAYVNNSYGLQNVGKTQDISSVNLSGAVGVGMNYALGKHVSVAVEPRLNYYFNSINSNPDVDYRPYRIGIFTGVYYAF